MNRAETVRTLREASKVERCHTLRHHGSYTVGQHSYDMANLLLSLHPAPSMDLLKAVLWHDCAERWTGDVPRPVKSAYPQLEHMLKDAEAGIMGEIGVDMTLSLTQEDNVWLRAVDSIELWLWSVEEVETGNKCAAEIRDALWAELTERGDWMPLECRKFVREYEWRPCSELTANWRRG